MAVDYDSLKAALTARFQLSAETYRRGFHASKRKEGETFVQFIYRTKYSFGRWLELAGKQTRAEDLQDLVLMEQLINSVSPELATFIKERQPANVNETARLAQIYEEARRGVKKGDSGNGFSRSGDGGPGGPGGSSGGSGGSGASPGVPQGGPDV